MNRGMNRAALVVLGLGLTQAAEAFAQGAAAAASGPSTPPAATSADSTPPPCPPGAFCEAAEVTPPPTRSATPPPVVANEWTLRIPAPRPGSDPTRPRVIVVHPGPDGQPDQIVVYEDGAAPPRTVSGTLPPAPPEPPSYHGSGHHEFRAYGRHEWGLALRLQGALLPRPDTDRDASGIGGVGLSLRRRLLPTVVLDMGVDLLGGVDPNGWRRSETPLSVSTLLYLNPRSATQFYLLGGANVSFARVQSESAEPNLAQGTTDAYVYFGAQMGAGLEFRLTKLVGLNLDAIGILRTRIDDDGDGRHPEHYDPASGLGSNSSAAGLLRAGLSFWW